MEYFFFLTDTRHIWTCIKVSEWYWHIAASAREVWHLTQQHLASSVTQLLQHAPVFPSLSPQFADIFRCFVLEMTDYCWLLSFFFVLAQWFVTHIACDQNITPLPHPLQASRRNNSLCTLFLFFKCKMARWKNDATCFALNVQCKRAVRVGILWKYHVILNTTFTWLVYLLLFYVVVVFTDREKVEALFTNSEKTLDLEPCTG